MPPVTTKTSGKPTDFATTVETHTTHLLQALKAPESALYQAFKKKAVDAGFEQQFLAVDKKSCHRFRVGAALATETARCFLSLQYYSKFLQGTYSVLQEYVPAHRRIHHNVLELLFWASTYAATQKVAEAVLLQCFERYPHFRFLRIFCDEFIERQLCQYPVTEVFQKTSKQLFEEAFQVAEPDAEALFCVFLQFLQAQLGSDFEQRLPLPKKSLHLRHRLLGALFEQLGATDATHNDRVSVTALLSQRLEVASLDISFRGSAVSTWSNNAEHAPVLHSSAKFYNAASRMQAPTLECCLEKAGQVEKITLEPKQLLPIATEMRGQVQELIGRAVQKPLSSAEVIEDIRNLQELLQQRLSVFAQARMSELELVLQHIYTNIRHKKVSISRTDSDRLVFREMYATNTVFEDATAIRFLGHLLSPDTSSRTAALKNAERLLSRKIVTAQIAEQVNSHLSEIDYRDTFPIARNLSRKIIFYHGPTNSGKTFRALQHIFKASSGSYLAPLRLLALETAQRFWDAQKKCSFLTGEERRLDPEATYMCSTIEMLDLYKPVDTVIIDEIQMLEDRFRGWAWTQALFGAPASEVILTGSSEALPIVKKVAAHLGESLECIECSRLVPLTALQTPITIEKLPPKSALIAFSRKRVLELKEELLRSGKAASVIYGNLGPVIRNNEAERFRKNETDVLISTDAIAMGLNLPIDYVIFTETSKFDGVEVSDLSDQLVRQIAGRAGRFGLSNSGFVSGLSRQISRYVADALNRKISAIPSVVSVAPHYDFLAFLSENLQTQNLSECYDFFESTAKFATDWYNVTDLSIQSSLARIAFRHQLDFKTQYLLSLAPVSFDAGVPRSIFFEICESLRIGTGVQMPLYTGERQFPGSQVSTIQLELTLKDLVTYYWFQRHFPELAESEADIDATTEALSTQLSQKLISKKQRRSTTKATKRRKYEDAEF